VSINEDLRMMTAHAGMEFLASSELIAREIDPSHDTIADALLRLALLPDIRGKRTLVQAIHSFAFIIKDLGTATIANTITEHLEVQINDLRAEMTEKLQDIQTTIENSASSTLHEVTKATAAIATGPSTHATYAAAAATNTPFAANTSIDPRIRARQGILERQVLIDPQSRSDKALLSDLSNTALVERANQALQSDSYDENHTPNPDFKCLNARRLDNGGILLEFNSSPAANWIRTTGHTNGFTTNFSGDGNARIKQRGFSLVLYYIPITFRPDNLADVQEVEENNKMEIGSIKNIRWIKPVERRLPQQINAHAIITVSSAQIANKIILEGLHIRQKRIEAEKLRKEPLRCSICQKHNHIARSCKVKTNVCGTCGHAHRTAKCDGTYGNYCMPCRLEGHTSWSRDCPTFEAKCNEMNARIQENTMPYFPTDELWTQAIEPRAQPQTEKPARQKGRGLPPHLAFRPPGTLRQSTLQMGSWAEDPPHPPPSTISRPNSPPFDDPPSPVRSQSQTILPRQETEFRSNAARRLEQFRYVPPARQNPPAPLDD
jgi:hypothetical protein